MRASGAKPSNCVAPKLQSLVRLVPLRLVGLSGLEPLTSRLSGGRSNQLSYKPVDSANARLRPQMLWKPRHRLLARSAA